MFRDTRKCMRHDLPLGLRLGGRPLKSWLTIANARCGWLPWRVAWRVGLAAAGLAVAVVDRLGALMASVLAGWSAVGSAAVLVSHRWLLASIPSIGWGCRLAQCPFGGDAVADLWCRCGAVGGFVVRLGAARGPARLSTAFTAAWLWALVELLLRKARLFWIGLGVAPLPGDRWLAGLAWFGGAPLLAALQLLISWLLWRLRWRALLVVLVVAHGLGAAALAAVPSVGMAGQELSVVLGQPNLPTREKFSAQQQQRQRQLLIRAMAVAEQQGADAVVLPEGALPLGQALPAMPAPLLSGGFRRQELEERSSVLWFPAGSTRPQQWIDKQRLVPLGEWVPGGWLGSQLWGREPR